MNKQIDRRTLEAPSELIAAMKRLAARQQRSLNAEIRLACEAWLRAHGEVIIPPDTRPSEK